MKSYLFGQNVRPSTVLLGFLSVSFFMALASFGHAQMPSPKAEFLTVESNQVREWTEFSARISPTESVNIIPLVGGRIQKVLFRDGEDVAKGQALFVIDPRPFEANVKNGQAVLATAKARARLTSQELGRSRDLIKSELISQSVFDEALTADEVTQASVLQAESSLMEAQLNLEYAHIDSPIAGRIGRAELTVGNVVAAGAAAPVLTTIVSQVKVYAEFDVDERTYLGLNHNLQTESEMPVQLTLTGMSEVLYEGYLHAFDNHVNSATGTIRARAIFDNIDNRLIPGMYVGVRLGSGSTNTALLIPERAIGTNQDRKFVYVIDENNTAQYREVVLGQQQKGWRAIRSGLQVGERVIINGLARIRPNATVEPVQSESADDVASIEL